MRFIPGLLLLISFSAPSVKAASLTGDEIMTRNEDVRKLNEIQASAILIVGHKEKEGEKTKNFTWWRKLTADRVRYNTLTRFHSPAEVRGEAILFLEHENDQSDVQLYLPTYKKTRRVESQAQSGSFMGSELSYADIATPHVGDYKHSLISTSACCYGVESTPATDAVKQRTGYSKSVQQISKENFMATSGEYFGLDGALKKRVTTTDIKEVDLHNHKWMAHSIRVENSQTGKYTVLKFEKVKVNAGIADSVFTAQNLAREQ